MKGKWLTIIACFAVGVTLGWWLSGPESGHASGDAGDSLGERRAGNVGTGFEARTKGDADLGVSSKQLTELVALGRATALSMENMQHGNPTQLDTLAKWAGLDVAQKQQLEAILREAAQARLGWESKEVKATRKEAGDWVLEFPSDKGSSRAALKERIEATFPPDAANAIQLAGDLDNFFGFGYWAPGFRHGKVEIRTRRSDGTYEMLADGNYVEIEADTDLGSLKEDWRIEGINTRSTIFRVVRLLGPMDEVLREAAEASR